MNTQAILQILDDIAKESIESFGKSIEPDMYPTWIKTAKERISSLPSLDIDSLWNYDYTETWMEYVWTAWMWEYIRYDDLKKLLQDTLELNQ